MLIQEMTKSECLRILSGTRLGRLACARENQPYVVPIYFVYGEPEPYLYSVTTLGQKVEWMRSNPLVCVELDEVEGDDNWTSIVIVGRYEELPDTPEWEQGWLRAYEPGRRPARPTWTGSREQLHAHALLQKHGEWWEPGCASCTHRNPQQPFIPVFYRICIDRITGRRATPSSGGPVRSGTPSPTGKRQSWLRRIVPALSKVVEKAVDKVEQAVKKVSE
jgi:nitroimidazol reductase NimA-like FMN-containing flavoprotein (pyridoxamine 5'-phosphate oxidase superfamily)